MLELLAGESFQAGVLSTAVVGILVYLIRKLFAHSSGLSGVWEDEICDHDDPSIIIKRDRFKIKHRKNGSITAIGERIIPHDEKRNWKLTGVSYDGHIILVYYPPDLVGDSRGCIFVSLDESRRNGTQLSYTGQYYKREAGEFVIRNIRIIKKRNLTILELLTFR